MAKIVFFDIDTQFDFIDPKGKLYVKGSEAIVKNLKLLTEFAESRKIKIISTVDAHSLTDPELKSWPPHCIKGTDGQKKIPETLIDGNVIIGSQKDIEAIKDLINYPQVILEKSVLNVFDESYSDSFIKSLSIGHFVVYGVATEYCVREEGLGLLKRGYKVTVVEDAIKPISEKAGKATLEEFRKLGASFAKTSQIIDPESRILS